MPVDPVRKSLLKRLGSWLPWATLAALMAAAPLVEAGDSMPLDPPRSQHSGPSPTLP